LESSIEVSKETVKVQIPQIVLNVIKLSATIQNLPASNFISDEKINDLFDHMSAVKSIVQQASSAVHKKLKKRKAANWPFMIVDLVTKKGGLWNRRNLIQCHLFPYKYILILGIF